MRRRRVLSLAAGVALAPRLVRAQPRARPVRLGVLSGGTPDEIGGAVEMRAAIAQLGWAEGLDYTMKERFAAFATARMPALVDELLREGIDILIVVGPAGSVLPLAERSVPVVFVFSSDPVVAGLVRSLARPGGNATGISQLAFELVGKRLELLREIAPATSRTAVLHSPSHPGERGERERTQISADWLGIELVIRPVRDRGEVETALAATAAAGCDSLLCFFDPVTLTSRTLIAEHARRRRIPSVFARREFCAAGGLASYGPNVAALYARAAYFVERIAAGARAGELPVELPTVIETIVNKRTADEIGIALPPTMLALADEVIE